MVLTKFELLDDVDECEHLHFTGEVLERKDGAPLMATEGDEEDDEVKKLGELALIVVDVVLAVM
jgi:hypothetical protein